MILDAENVPADLRGESFNVIVDNMDTCIPEQISANRDGSYTVFLNARLTYERNKESMDHAFDHVREDDWSKFYVQDIESERHNGTGK